MPNRLSAIARWALVLGWTGLIWYLSSVPDLRSPFPQDFLLRKIAHALEFAVLALLIFWSLGTNKLRTKNVVRNIVSAALAIIYSGIDEVHQGYVSGRVTSVKDVTIDLLGITAGLGAVWALRRYLVWRMRVSK